MSLRMKRLALRRTEGAAPLRPDIRGWGLPQTVPPDAQQGHEQGQPTQQAQPSHHHPGTDAHSAAAAPFMQSRSASVGMEGADEAIGMSSVQKPSSKAAQINRVSSISRSEVDVDRTITSMLLAFFPLSCGEQE